MRRLLFIVGLLFALTATGTIGIHLLTGKPLLESAYLSIITLTTVGSQDVAGNDPKLMAFVMIYLVCGLGTFTYAGFQIGEVIVDSQFRKILEKRRMEKAIAALDDHFVVCGVGRMGTTICEHLTARGQPFVVIDHSAERLNEIARPREWLFVHGDATDDDVLISAGIKRARALATALPTDADNIYVVLSARMLSSKIQIIARSSDDEAMKKLQRAGASRVVSPFSSGAVKMARFMLNPSIEDFLEVADDSDRDLELAEVQVTPGSPYIGKELSQTDLRELGVMVIGIRRSSGERLLPPPGTAVIQEEDSLFVFGNARAVSRMTSRQE
ncbi:MAG: potassium channel protein [Planctomycetota bacterium]|nr:MAG: potassium channel protein [Planctomycetota bacterium]REJ97495.1 MAG: potassium channel protein [Planctomycetota bacterium]REK20953.1 MAG: potassium channel protein [Planctomycetota bacterium]REK37265.1 MAG: potassium channel protein [Planctomycetota bacterium]